MISITRRAVTLRFYFFIMVMLRLGFGVVAAQEAPLVELRHPIIEAAATGKTSAVEEYLNSGVSVNVYNPNGITALSAALKANQLATARLLVARGFNPLLVGRNFSNQRYQIGTPVLAMAAGLGAEDIVTALLDRGLKLFPEYYWEDWPTSDPIMAAVQAEQLPVLGKLLAAVNREKAQREKALSRSHEYLTACRSLEVIKRLTDFGMDFNALNNMGPFPSVLHVYAERGWGDGVTMLLQLGADPTVVSRGNSKLPEEVAKDARIKNQLVLAAMRLRVERAGAAAGVQAVPSRLPVAVFEAALNASEAQALTRLNEVSATDLQAEDGRGWSLLNYAVKYRYLQLARALIDRGADVRHLTERGSSLIAFATEAGDIELVKLIHSKGADVDGADHGTYTALLVAVEKKNRALVDLLLSYGAKVEPARARSFYGQSSWRSGLMIAARTGDIPLMEQMLKAGGDLDAADSAGESAVFYAVRSNNVQALQWLIARGAYLKMKTSRGTNVLTLAASLGSLEMIKILLELGVTHPDALKYAERAPTREAAAYIQDWDTRQKPNDPIRFWRRSDLTVEDVRRYLAEGGDKDFGDGEETPLQRMAELQNAEAVELLIERGADPRRRIRDSRPPVFVAFAPQQLTEKAPTEEKSLEVFRVFIEKAGISVNERTNIGSDIRERVPTGHTLLQQAISNGWLKFARYLLEKGADPLLVSSWDNQDAFVRLRETTAIGDREREEFRVMMEECSRRLRRENAPARPEGTQLSPKTP